MTLEAGRELDRRCVLSWLKEIYLTQSTAFNEYTDDELKMFAHDAIVLLMEQKAIVRCKDCKNAEILPWLDNAIICKKHNYTGVRPDEFYCADGERKEARR